MPRDRPDPRRGRLRAVPGPPLRDPGRDRYGPRHRGSPGRHEHHARGDRRARGRHGGSGHQPGHQPRRRHHRRAAQPRGGPRGRPGRRDPHGRPPRPDRPEDLSRRVESAATDTRQRLVDAALQAFAEHGVHNASLLEITRRAGQRNRGAVHYHFGSRAGMIAAVLEAYADEVGRRGVELLAAARERPDDDIASVIEALVRPLVEVSEMGWRGRCYVVVLGEVIQQDITPLGPAVQEAVARTGGYDLFALMRERLRPMAMDVDLEGERLAVFTDCIMHAIADRARAAELPPTGRTPLPTERFIANLVSMGTAMLTAPAPPVG
ncbi:TetR family transcriptional regulator [Nocardioides sp. zg-579]|uniref:TetR family transcriptional regulator n=1 Tax=Nocardioides marmotae TaxID=2663857 RepID=A0A6I3J692_9ACTN|nr:TetR family transcriptional regulator [Gordonia jinghuaiqii]MTB94994.1 TetR family transcriptional regulator [Nocardioides marmotae]